MLDNTILAGINGLDEPSFDALFKELFPPLLLFTENLTRNSVESEDIVMNAFTKLWLGIKAKNLKFESLPQLRAYIYKTAKNEALSFLQSLEVQERYIRQQNHITDKEKNDNIEYLTVESLLLDGILKEIDNLPDKCQQVFKLCYFSGLSRLEIAEKLNLSINSVNSHHKYAVKLLKKVLSEKDFALLLMAVLSFSEK